MDPFIRINNEINWDQTRIQRIPSDNPLLFRNQILKEEAGQPNNHKEFNKLVEYVNDNDQDKRLKGSMNKGIASYLQSIKETPSQQLIETNSSFFEISEDRKVISIKHWCNGKEV